MKLLLVTLGGKIDCCLDRPMQPGQPYVRSHAFNVLTHLCRVHSRETAFAMVDFLPVGRKGATETTATSCNLLGDVIDQQQSKYDRIIVTAPARESFWLSRSLATDWLLPACPIIVTGAEAPSPKDLAKNRTDNLTMAAFNDPDLAPNVYLTEGKYFKAALPKRAEYERRHLRRVATMRAFTRSTVI